MDLKQLCYFLVVRDHNSINRAAPPWTWRNLR